jgi:proprotein convertase subtilisin/kexin type 5
MIGYLYIQEKCVFNCPLTLYNTLQNDISQCATCDSSCSDCYISSTTCSGCVSGYLLYATYCNQTAYCSEGYFIAFNNVCLPCQFPCANCFGVSTNCTSCLKGAFHQNQCIILCPNGFYTDGNQMSNITCKNCANNCLTCLSATLCLSCSTGRYLYDSQCLTSCPNSTYYPNPANNTCTECPPPCK